MNWARQIHWRKARRTRKLEEIGALAAQLVVKLLDVNRKVRSEELDHITQSFGLEIRRLLPEDGEL